MPVDYDIYPEPLVEFIKTTLLAPISNLAVGFPWDFSAMVVCETGSWQDVIKMDLKVPYFHGHFLKVKTGAKSDGSQVFSPPKSPTEFVLIIDHEQWIQAEEYNENSRSTYQQTESIHLVCMLQKFTFNFTKLIN